MLRSLRFALLLAATAAVLVGPLPAAEDTGFLDQYAATYRFRLGTPSSFRSTADGKAILFLRSEPRSLSRELFELNVETGKERRLLRAADLLGSDNETLSAEEKARRERQRLVATGIARFQLSPDGRTVLIPLSGKLFLYDRLDHQVTELEGAAGGAIDPQFSPDGDHLACVRNGEIHVTDLDNDREWQLTHGAGGPISHGEAEFVAQEEMSRHHGFWWSPDGKQILYQRTDVSALETLTIADASRPQKPARSWPYPRPGKSNADVRLGIVSIQGGEPTWIEWDREAFEYVAAVSWWPDAPPTVLVQNRRQTEQRLLAVEPTTGKTRELLRETDPAWVEIDETMPQWLPDGRAFLWTTERRGALQLELRHADGSLARELTPTSLGMQRFGRLYAEQGVAIVVAGGDPTRSDLYRVSLTEGGAKPGPLTPEHGVHAIAGSEPGPHHVQVSSTLAGDRHYRVADHERRLGVEIRSVAEEPPFVPNVEWVQVGDGPAFHAAVIRPRDFDEERRYPVIVNVYGGPTSVMVRADPRRYVLNQWLADQGYIVAVIDGRGTPYRGRDWHRTVARDLITVPLDDQATALQALGRRFPEMDLDRVGIYGWSFGGYFSAMAVLLRPDVFHAAVAGAPVIDWQYYDTHYTERYMGLPEENEDGYRVTNAMTHAGNLSRPLMLVHGTADDNVYFAHSLLLADALFRSGKPVDFLPLTGFTHRVAEKAVVVELNRRRLDFLHRNVRDRKTTTE